MESRPPPFLALPGEIIQNVFSFTSIQGLARCNLVCKRLAQLLDDPLLWKTRCLQQYRYWNPDHQFSSRLPLPVPDTNWRSLLAKRQVVDQSVRADLEDAISSQVQRIQRLSEIVANGYEAKDYLLQQVNDTPDEAEDSLARRYWSNQLLGAIERSAALVEWRKAREDPDHPLERALGAVDLFVVEQPPLTLDELSEAFDRIAKIYISEHPQLRDYSARTKANTLVAFLQTRNLTGVAEESFSDLQNNLISVALCQADHPSIPLVSSVIYCSLARRIGLNAKVCNFPLQVNCIVTAPAGFDVDGNELRPELGHVGGAETTFYMDPFRGSSVSLGELSARLTYCGVPQDDRKKYLAPCSAADVLCRTAANIQRMLHETRHTYVTCLNTVSHLPFATTAVLPTGPRTLNPHRASYAAAHILLLFSLLPSQSFWGEPLDGGPPLSRMMQAHRALNGLYAGFDRHFKFTDCNLVEQYVISTFYVTKCRREREPPGQEEYQFIARMLREARKEDLGPTTVTRRHTGGQQSESPTLQEMTWPVAEYTWNDIHNAQGPVTYRVGTYLRHKRYGYHGAIIGWHDSCQQSASWITRMGVDQLSRGRAQAFYHVFAEDESERYVAEENIEAMGRHLCATPDNHTKIMPRESLMRAAGRFFLRWDDDEERFVSNVREAWPDD